MKKGKNCDEYNNVPPASRGNLTYRNGRLVSHRSYPLERNHALTRFHYNIALYYTTCYYCVILWPIYYNNMYYNIFIPKVSEHTQTSNSRDIQSNDNNIPILYRYLYTYTFHVTYALTKTS